MEKGIRYYDVRHVTGDSTHIDIDNGVIESAGTSFFSTAVIRVLGQAGWGILTIDNYEDPVGREFDDMLQTALDLARITDEPTCLAEAPNGMLAVPRQKEDPKDVSLEEKTSLLGEIETAAKVPGIVNTRATYIERSEQTAFRDSSGNEYTYGICRSGFNVMAVASRDGNVQMAFERLHSIHGLNIRHQQELGRVAGDRAVALINAGVVKGGTMDAVLDPELAGVFAHEAVGHASEGDLVHDGNSVLAGKTGEKIGNDLLTIVDDPTLHEFGFEPVDAEGVMVARTEIIRKGIVNAYLHNRETLASVGHGIPGHARAMPGEPPLVRMSNTFIETGDAASEEMIAEVRQGILLCGSRGGQVDPGRGVFQFNAEYGYLVRNGEQGEMIRDVSLSGEILSTLHAIEMCGKERLMSQGYCGKGGQSVPVSDGAPYVLLRNAVVGGSGSD
ncbi:MAG TPA: TldD/PmbA family protein [Methanoregulaceae archaeon]|nr:TldD/PmbA family protein [Methanoregulaceae archaeon]